MLRFHQQLNLIYKFIEIKKKKKLLKIILLSFKMLPTSKFLSDDIGESGSITILLNFPLYVFKKTLISLGNNSGNITYTLVLYF
jgi:hypothetical protein